MMNIYEKIVQIMSEVEYLAKNDEVKFGSTKYMALSEEKVTDIMRKKMVQYKLIVYPIEMQSSRNGNISHVDVKYRIQNAEAPDEHIDVVSCGDGADTQDKGAGKAMTYAFKYMWLRTFAIPTGEDPDKVSSEELDAKEKTAAEKVNPSTEAKPEKPNAAADKAKSGTPTCQGCGREIKPVEANGKTVQVKTIIGRSRKDFGKDLCYNCLQFEVKRKQAKDKMNADRV